MTSDPHKPSIVVIDDNEVLLTRLTESLGQKLEGESVELRSWSPQDGQDPLEEFERLIDDDTILVVTDYDLTGRGVTGLFGVIIVSWCQIRSIPVGDFSRANATNLPSEPNLFELRVPTEINEAAGYTAAMFRGFKQLRDDLTRARAGLVDLRSPAEVLAALLGRPHLEGQLALYMSRLQDS